MKRASIFYLLLGAGLFTLVTWRWNIPLAAWIAPVFLIRFFREQSKWLATLPAILLLWAASVANKIGGWGMDLWLLVVVSLIAALPMILSLYLDRYTSKRLCGIWQTLVFPAAFVALDYAVSLLLMGLGTVFTLAPGQFYHPALVQVLALTGIWGMEFLVVWAAPVVNAAWEHGFDLRLVRAPLSVYLVCLVGVMAYGGVRLVAQRPQSSTVRVAGVTVAHVRNYWDELIDKGTPREQAAAYASEFQGLEDNLFAQSEQAVRGGAKVIFWSEGDAFLLPEHKDQFFQRAQAFAVEHQVYLIPAYLALRYGDTSGFNGLRMITPTGEVAYEYEKTMSWYATTSDGILHSVDTPYGRIGAVVCFDLDFPTLIRQAAGQKVDILLVPAFDTYLARLYHTEVGLLRGVEDGFSVARMVNEGTSMAVDYRGHLLASQDFFTTTSPIMYADLPTRGVTTLYGELGDWFAWVSIVLAIGLTGVAAFRPRFSLAGTGLLRPQSS